MPPEKDNILKFNQYIKSAANIQYQQFGHLIIY